MGDPTEGNMAISHPGRDRYRLEGRETRHFVSIVQVPHDSFLSNIVANNKSARSSFTYVVDGYPLNVGAVFCEPSLQRKGVMMKAKYCISLGIEKQ